MAEPTGFQPAPANAPPMNFDFHSAPSFDVLEIVPPLAGERLRVLRQRRSDLHALCVPFEQIRELTTAKIDAENRLAKLQAHPQNFGFNLPADNRSVVTAKATFGKAADDLRRLNERADSRVKAWQESSAALSNAESWLRDGRPTNVILEDRETELPKLAKGESTILDQIENRRRRAREIKALIHRHESAPYPSSHVKRKMREEIQALAMQGAPVVAEMVEHNRKIVWPTLSLKSHVIGNERNLAFAEIDATIPLLAWLFQKELVSALDHEIDAESDDGASLSAEDRQIKIAEAMGDLADVEYAESALIFAAQAQNLPCEHRADINPACLLGLKFITRAGNGHDMPPTSPEHGYNILRR
jgi:hypothetical protein